MAVAVGPKEPGYAGWAGSARWTEALLVCGVVSSALYVAMNVVGALLYPGYSLAAQTISELYAIGAPSRGVVAALMVVYNLLLYAFGAGVWRSAGGKLALRVAAAGMVGKEVLGMAVTLFFPMHTREVLAAGGATLRGRQTTSSRVMPSAAGSGPVVDRGRSV